MDCFLLNGLSETEKNQVRKKIGSAAVFEKSDELYKKGFIGILNSGTAVIKRQGDTGGSLTVRKLKEKDVFGVASVFGEWKEGLSSITALSRCTVYYISEDTLKELITAYPTICFNYISFLTGKIRFLNRRIDALSAGDTEQKLYEFLVAESDKDGNIKLDFGMAELARRLKIGRSSLYRGLESLQKGGLIIRDNHNFKIN